MENNRKGCINRDRNAVNNMVTILEQFLKDGSRPNIFKRGKLENYFTIGEIKQVVENENDGCRKTGLNTAKKVTGNVKAVKAVKAVKVVKVAKKAVRKIKVGEKTTHNIKIVKKRVEKKPYGTTILEIILIL